LRLAKFCCVFFILLVGGCIPFLTVVDYWPEMPGTMVRTSNCLDKKSVAYKVESITLISSLKGWPHARKNAPKRLLSLRISGGITAQFLSLKIAITKLATNQIARLQIPVFLRG